MKKAYELSTLTGTQVLLLVASETGHVYTFATPKLQPLITKPEGKNLIQACLNASDVTQTQPQQAQAPSPAQVQQQQTGRMMTTTTAYTDTPALFYPTAVTDPMATERGYETHEKKLLSNLEVGAAYSAGLQGVRMYQMPVGLASRYLDHANSQYQSPPPTYSNPTAGLNPALPFVWGNKNGGVGAFPRLMGSVLSGVSSPQVQQSVASQQSLTASPVVNSVPASGKKHDD